MFNFGTSTPNDQRTSGLSSFQTPATQSTPFSFGQPNTSSSSSLMQPSQPISQSSNTTFPSFNAPFGTPSTFQSTQQTQKAIPSYQETHPLTQIKAVLDSYDPTTPYYKFQHPFYNVVDPADIQKYGRPAGVDDLLWDQAVKDNPNPSVMVPVIASGFPDLEKRRSAQLEQMKIHLEKVALIKRTLDSFQLLHSVEFESQIVEIQLKQTAINQRLLRIVEKFQTQKNKGFSFSREEEQLKGKLDELLIRITRELKLKDKAYELSKRIESEPKRDGEIGMQLTEDSVKRVEAVLTDQNGAIRCIIDGLNEQNEAIQQIESGCKDFSFAK